MTKTRKYSSLSQVVPALMGIMICCLVVILTNLLSENRQQKLEGRLAKVVWGKVYQVKEYERTNKNSPDADKIRYVFVLAEAENSHTKTITVPQGAIVLDLNLKDKQIVWDEPMTAGGMRYARVRWNPGKEIPTMYLPTIPPRDFEGTISRTVKEDE